VAIASRLLGEVIESGGVIERAAAAESRVAGKVGHEIRPSIKARAGRQARSGIERKARSKLLPVYHGSGADLSGGFNLELGGSATVSNLNSMLGPNFISNPLEAIDYGIGSAEKMGTHPRLYRATVNPATHLQERTHQEFITKHVMPLFPGGDVGQISGTPTLEQVGKIREHLLGQGYESVGFSYGNRGGKAGAEASHIIFLQSLKAPEADIKAASYAEKKMQELYGVTEFMPSARDKDILRYSRLQRQPRVAAHSEQVAEKASTARKADIQAQAARAHEAERAVENDPNFDPFDDAWMRKMSEARKAAEAAPIAAPEPSAEARLLVAKREEQKERFLARTQAKQAAIGRRPPSSAQVGLRTHSRSVPARHSNPAMTTVDNYLQR
jgi:hypothetical protein